MQTLKYIETRKLTNGNVFYSGYVEIIYKKMLGIYPLKQRFVLKYESNPNFYCYLDIEKTNENKYEFERKEDCILWLNKRVDDKIKELNNKYENKNFKIELLNTHTSMKTLYEHFGYKR